MSRITRAFLEVAFAVALGGALACGNSEPSAGTERRADPDDVVQKIEALVDEACACRDIACIEGVESKFYDALMVPEPSKADQAKIMKSSERIGECMAKVVRSQGVTVGP